jgi:hypothetical protein
VPELVGPREMVGADQPHLVPRLTSSLQAQSSVDKLTSSSKFPLLGNYQTRQTYDEYDWMVQ